MSITTKPILPAKVEKFVFEYLADGNATAAAARSGYSPGTAKQQGSRLLKRPDVAEALTYYRHLMREQREQSLSDSIKRSGLDSARTRLTIARIAYADIRRLKHADGKLKQLHELDDEIAPAIQGFELNDEGHVVAYRLVSRAQVLDMAAKITGEFQKDNEQRRSSRDMTDDEIRERVMQLLGGDRPSDTQVQ